MKAHWQVEKLGTETKKIDGRYKQIPVWKRLKREYKTMNEAIRNHHYTQGVRYVQIVTEIDEKTKTPLL
jgi:hypothetical protein